jgi:hypothetical protein
MSAFTTTYLAWRHETDTVSLAIDERRVPVPDAVARLLLAGNPRALTEDPATDLLLREQDLRLEAVQLAKQLVAAAAEVDIARDEVAAAEHETGWAGRRVRQAAGGYLADAIAEHATLTARHRAARAAIGEIRAFVRDAQVPDGWLADAAAGWARNPEPPSWVFVFDSEEAFLDADARRSVPGWWGGSTLGGFTVGYEWRRDGDDEDPVIDELLRAGPWWLGWMPRTGEIYATRRSAYLPQQVWLLGTGFLDKTTGLAPLVEAEPLMRQPNSLILAAQVVHQHALAAGDTDEQDTEQDEEDIDGEPAGLDQQDAAATVAADVKATA